MSTGPVAAEPPDRTAEGRDLSAYVRSTPEPVEAAAASTRAERMANRVRNPKWKNPALYIDMSICINCDTCIRHCPPHFGAIFNHGIDVIIIPELCSGCLKCVDPCPVDCIHPVEDEVETPLDWWDAPEEDDPYR